VVSNKHPYINVVVVVVVAAAAAAVIRSVIMYLLKNGN
jgi:hypothetical protein